MELNELDKAKLEYEICQEYLIDYPLNEAGIHCDMFAIFNQWIISENPDYLDQLVQTCAYYGIPIKGLLLKHVGALAQKRMLRLSNLKKTNKVLKDEYSYQAHKKALQLIYWCECKNENAYDLVANWGYSSGKLKKKSSSLQKESTTWRSKHQQLEAQIKEYKCYSEVDKEHLRNQILEGTYIAEVNEGFKGTRR
ncbi:hypothetical protein [Shewanella fidelis]|uniref:Uncharacterized protein n=1 Tax=Shewanella fidelis TaxID=173509 RepID=A0AAW8NK13_9GAMM|nr:hypothetical protein [Shewanella fidelis]MDR8522228.1 hypothetical protein [Shewanella fidelis]MDW4812556.1 hypothetical protein [Shewanella fidelis]MDW4816304.1 hypothetical protein [Shewanella fidelis]MDW4820797.1 hypothetical protein [Shewanella fidelis]MDW4825020.1 hypothetical protein [Shewanella fidelis]